MSAYVKVPFFPVSLLLLALGCGANEKSNDHSVGDLPDLQGDWKADCVDETNSDGASSSITSFHVSGSSITYENMNYSDNTCTTQSFKLSIQTTATDAGAATTPSHAKKLNLIYDAIQMTFLTDEGMTGANQAKLFGFANWQKNVAMDIIGLKADATSEALPEKGHKSFDLYAIQDNKLYFGDTTTADGESEATRPTALETTGFTKQ